jgi:tRNA pseudouridine-54 N-methylase
VDITKYTIKDIPGTTGRLDVISRCILATLLSGKDYFEKDIQIWVFLDNYGTFVFNSEHLKYDDFPKNELLLTDYFVNLIKRSAIKDNDKNHFRSPVEISKMRFIEAIEHIIDLNYRIFILEENGEDFFKIVKKINSKQNLLFIVGNQSGVEINSMELKALNLVSISLGSQSYLASSVIRLIKLHLIL